MASSILGHFVKSGLLYFCVLNSAVLHSILFSQTRRHSPALCNLIVNKSTLILFQEGTLFFFCNILALNFLREDLDTDYGLLSHSNMATPLKSACLWKQFRVPFYHISKQLLPSSQYFLVTFSLQNLQWVDVLLSTHPTALLMQWSQELTMLGSNKEPEPLCRN